jgi:hypothetical protein
MIEFDHRRELDEFHNAAIRKKTLQPVTRDVFHRDYPADLQTADGIAACTWIQLTDIAEFVHTYITTPNGHTDKIDAIARALWFWQQEKRNGDPSADVCDVQRDPEIRQR